MRYLLFPLLLILASCSTKAAQNSDLVSIQILDRNGFSETISTKDRLETYVKTDFLNPQPYQKVVRVYGKASQGKTASKVTTYHSNGHPWQYLEIENSRAHGKFNEWHPNGQMKIDARVIEGTPDVNEVAQLTWFFEGPSLVYDEKGHLIAKIFYDKGLLEGTSYYYSATGKISKETPYHKDKMHGVYQLFDEEGNVIERIPYQFGEKDGIAVGHWKPEHIKYNEEYRNGLLWNGTYFDMEGNLVAEIQNGEGWQALFEDNSLSSFAEYHQGVIEGKVENFNSEGHVVSYYHMKDGAKNGEEREFYPSQTPKLSVRWENDILEGETKTWYDTGAVESQREMHNNKKHGQSYAWYKNGDLRLVEEYQEDRLVSGSYFKPREKKAVSKIEQGKGVATLFDKEGKFLKKVSYDKGIPQSDGHH